MDRAGGGCSVILGLGLRLDALNANRGIIKGVKQFRGKKICTKTE